MATFNMKYWLLLKRKIILQILYLRRIFCKTTNKKRKYWVRKTYADRQSKSEYHLLVQDLKLHDQNNFFRCFRMSPENFEMLLSGIGPKIKKVTTKIREPISVGQRLCVTLRYLVTGDAHVTIAASYRMSPTTVGCIVNETCAVISNLLCDKGYVSPPSSEASKNVSAGFEQMWNFPNALGAIDGKHVIIQAPPNSSSLYFNYKKRFSIVLMAVFDAKYRFTLVDIGDTGRQSDGSVYTNSHLGYAIENDLLNIPQPSNFTQSEMILSYVFIGDDAFGLNNHLMKPYPF